MARRPPHRETRRLEMARRGVAPRGVAPRGVAHREMGGRGATRPGPSPPGPACRLCAALGSHAARLCPRLLLRVARVRGDLLGAAGESIAARALARRGLRIVGRRVATPAAEVDLVAYAGSRLVVVEVKTGRVPLQAAGDADALRWRPADRLGPRQRARLQRAAGWLARTVPCSGARVDLVEVLVDVRGRARVLHHPGLRPRERSS